MKTIEIYTDGSSKLSLQNSPGTCAFVAVDKQVVLHKESYRYEKVTNNMMELMGCIKALKWVEEQSDVGRVYLHTDSQYVQLGLTEWIINWRKNGWKNASRKPVVNKELWIQLDALKKKLPIVQFQWVRGHNNNKFNEMADQLCEEAYSKPIYKEQKGTSLIADLRNKLGPIKNQIAVGKMVQEIEEGDKKDSLNELLKKELENAHLAMKEVESILKQMEEQ